MGSIRGSFIVLVALGVTLPLSTARAANSAASESVATDSVEPVQSCTNSCMSSGCASGSGCCRTFGTSLYADFLYLCPRNEGIEYAVVTNGPTSAGVVPLQLGDTGVVDPNFSAGFRVGFDTALTDCSSVYAEFTNYRNTANDSIATTAPLVLASMVLNPTSLNGGSAWLSATASENIDFDLVDVGCHYNLWSCNQNFIGVIAGVRYGHLSQQFHADYSVLVSETVDTGVTLDCVGPRVGLDGNWNIGRGFFVHGKAAASFVGGEYHANYQDVSAAAPSTPTVTTTWHEQRFSSILDGELAVGWQNCSGRVKVMAGYLINDWCNVVKPSDFISGVQANSYRGTNQVGQTALVFEGLMAHAEVNW